MSMRARRSKRRGSTGSAVPVVADRQVLAGGLEPGLGGGGEDGATAKIAATASTRLRIRGRVPRKPGDQASAVAPG
jgi:hypothetical protein